MAATSGTFSPRRDQTLGALGWHLLFFKASLSSGWAGQH